jgi:hypothetical protein
MPRYLASQFMNDKNSAVRFDPAQLKRAPFFVRRSEKVRQPGQVSTMAAFPAPSSVSLPVANASRVKSRSAVTAQPDAPRAQDSRTSRLAQTSVGSSGVDRSKTATTGRQEFIERLKSPDWITRNPRGEHISRELKDAVAFLISICRRLERISEQLNEPPFKSERERQHVEFLSKRLLKSWAALSMASEGYYDDEAWARSVISLTAFEMMEIVSDLEALLKSASKVLDLQGKCKESDPDENLPKYWLTKDAMDRYQGVGKELVAVMCAAQQLNEKFARLPMKKKAGVRVGAIVPLLPSAGSPRKRVPRTGKPLFKVKHASKLGSLNKQASSIHECLGDLGRRLLSIGLQRHFVDAFLDNSATVLENTMQYADTLKAWETGLHRSRHHFLKAHAKLQDLAPNTSTLQPAELAIPQKIAANIYASFDNVINIVLDLASDGVTDIHTNQKREGIQQTPVKTISSPTTVTRHYLAYNRESLKNETDFPAQVSGTSVQGVSEDSPAEAKSGKKSLIQATVQTSASNTVNTGTPTSPGSPSPRKKANAGRRAQQLSVAWQEIENAAMTGKGSSD